MPLNYSIAMLKNPQKQDEEPKAYAKSQITGELTLKELGQQVASQTTVSRADVAAVIISTVENMIGGLRAGKQVDFGDLGKIPVTNQQSCGRHSRKIHGCQYYRSKHPICSRRRPEGHLCRNEFLTRTYTCSNTCIAQSSEGRADHRRYFRFFKLRRKT